MPTENRSSSNHATRAFTLDSLTAALEQIQAFHEISADLIAESVFGQPAQQGQGEPVALPARRPWNGLGNAADNLKASGWNACLDKIVELGPLYTHADPAEVERLRNCLRTEIEAGDSWKREAEELRDQLVEAQALLNEVTGDVHFVIASDTRQRIDAHLSASAEPSAAESDFSKQKHDAWRRAFYGEESAEPSNDLCAEGAHEFVPFRNDCVKCGEPYSAEPSAPLRFFGMNLVVSGNMPNDEIHLVGGEGGTVKMVLPSAPLPPVDGDLLPPINSKVLIHLGREDKWVEHPVVGYYAWGNHGLDQNVHRVFVRVRDAEGCLNARLLNDIRPVTLERKP